MDIDQLIKEGEKVIGTAIKHEMTGKMILKGAELETWAMKSVIYAEQNLESIYLIERLREDAKDLKKDGYDKANAILGVLKASKEG
ncbi:MULTISPECIES: hypothetical protein [Bacillus]|uniref:hypothetical protein n=1 Tax=Bacillus TaxID=1386 RepID=UPI000BA526C8|nr:MULTISPECIES: hypothetical protein [Bacillus]MBY6038938.1 hypothetical protein [Bacillus velezensis]MCA1240360.1 hypothetical protein [Bacillus velezensis]MDU0077284.1 hypothetical protein [Bacillus sp. IG2]MDU0102283.1 hypothetical protein [Bacillus sp. IS1]MEC2273038.1 hypothetical protein [Bacillus velezensis]